MMLVSVLMPVYKPDPGFLEEAVRSILEQDYKDLELVAVEDPSPANGRKVFESFNDSRIRYHLNEERTSLREQLNLGLSLCRGTYIARMDADDISMPHRVRRQFEFLQEHPEISVVGANLEFIDSTNKSLGFRDYPELHVGIEKAFRSYCPLPHPAVMFRKKDVEQCGGYREHAPIEDYDLWSRMLAAGSRFHNLPDVLLKYRIHGHAGKLKSLKKQLARTVEVKEKYFRHKSGWSLMAEARYLAEKMMMLLPAGLVLKLFMLTIAKKKSNS